MSILINKLPEELREKYQTQACVCIDVVECLKVAATLKLWFNRSYRDIDFSVPLALGRKKFFVDVLAKREDGVVAVECVPSVNLGWLRERMALLRRCFPSNGYFVIVFPSTVSKRVNKAAFLADEVWVTDETNSKVASMLFATVWHKG
jgi:hypothetical protein